MFCEFCHYEDFDNSCKCYIVENSDCLSCIQCGRVQNLFFGDEILKPNLTDYPFSDKKKSVFLEISQKLNVSDNIADNAFKRFENFKKDILRSTKNNNILIAYCNCKYS